MGLNELGFPDSRERVMRESEAAGRRREVKTHFFQCPVSMGVLFKPPQVQTPKIQDPTSNPETEGAQGKGVLQTRFPD